MAKSKLRKNRKITTTKNTNVRFELRKQTEKRNNEANKIKSKKLPQGIEDLAILGVYGEQIPKDYYDKVREQNPEYFNEDGSIDINRKIVKKKTSRKKKVEEK